MIRQAIRNTVVVAIVCSLPATPPAEAQIGPDVVTSELTDLSQFGREGPIGSGTVGLAMTMTACNLGDETVEWFGLPDTNHPMLAQNLYRLKLVGGSERFEQIGLAWLKHGFGAAQQPGCGIACEPFLGGTELGVGCGDTYFAGQQATACDLGPRSMLHPYTGMMPRGDDLGTCGQFSSNYPSNNHIGHTHDGISHRLQVPDVDLTPALNPGARYFAEAHYLAPHEFVAGNGNQHNNASHREYDVAGPTPSGVFAFIEMGAMAISEPAVNAWPGTSQSVIEPTPLADGQAHLVCEITDLGGGLWHYEYAIYNMNLHESVGSLSIPVPSDVTLSNIGFHAPLNHAPELHANNYANDPWVSTVAEGAITWSTDQFEDRPFANAVRYGTLYNFRFDANVPPQGVDASVGLFRTGGSLTVAAQGPAPAGTLDCNGNSIDDRCDLDCNAPGCSVPGCGLSSDCTTNGIPDECEPDCDNDGTADLCELATAAATDCNGNAIPDECEPGGQTDCNTNGQADFCDLLLSTSEDFNGNGIPDKCDPHLGSIHVDDNAPNDPGPGDPTISDPNEDGSLVHPFDTIQEAINVSLSGDEIFVADGAYKGVGNRGLSFFGRAITLRSDNGPTNCVIDLELAAGGFDFSSGETPAARLRGFTIVNALGSGALGNPAINIALASPTISNCIITRSAGRAVECAGGSPTLVNCLVHGNEGLTAALFVSGSPTLINCVINASSTGLRLTGGSVGTVRNCVLWAGVGQAVVTNTGAVADIRYSNIKGGFLGAGNIDEDPLFVAPENDDYHLLPNSPCIDAGDNRATCELVDLDGNPRFLDDPSIADTGAGDGPLVDMGVYELVPSDCNDNGVADALDIAGEASQDANGNGVPDECERMFDDCNGNGLPDDCEVDCNNNGQPDDCDLAGGSPDCDNNLVPDSCDPDCNGNNIPDACDLATELSPDCNNNTIPDECEPDCNGNGVADTCDIAAETSDDCNVNTIPDSCESLNFLDCNNNGRNDVCDIADGSSDDCNDNTIPDTCEPLLDCNDNGKHDFCDIINGISPDNDGNGKPDECTGQPLPASAPHDLRKNRFISIDPNNALPVTIRVQLLDRACSSTGKKCGSAPDCTACVGGDNNGLGCSTGSDCPGGSCTLSGETCEEQSPPVMLGWVGEPAQAGGDALPGTIISEVVKTQPAARSWTESVVHLGDCDIAPVETYAISATADGVLFSDPLIIGTIEKPEGKFWADIVGGFDGVEWSSPNNLVNVSDVTAMIAFITDKPGKPHITRVDLAGGSPTYTNFIVNTTDLQLVIKGFLGDTYPPLAFVVEGYPADGDVTQCP